MNHFVSECYSEVTGQIEKNANGAYPVHEIEVLSECAELCKATEGCTAIDWDKKHPPYKNARCWIHTGKDLKVKDELGVDHYTFGPCVFNGSKSRVKHK